MRHGGEDVAASTWWCVRVGAMKSLDGVWQIDKRRQVMLDTARAYLGVVRDAAIARLTGIEPGPLTVRVHYI